MFLFRSKKISFILSLCLFAPNIICMETLLEVIKRQNASKRSVDLLKNDDIQVEEPKKKQQKKTYSSNINFVVATSLDFYNFIDII